MVRRMLASPPWTLAMKPLAPYGWKEPIVYHVRSSGAGLARAAAFNGRSAPLAGPSGDATRASLCRSPTPHVAPRDWPGDFVTQGLGHAACVALCGIDAPGPDSACGRWGIRGESRTLDT